MSEHRYVRQKSYKHDKIETTFRYQMLIILIVQGNTSVVVLIALLFWSRIFVLFEPYVRFYIFSSVRVAEWPPIGE